MRNCDKQPEDRMKYLKVTFQKLNNNKNYNMFFQGMRSKLDPSCCITGCLEESSVLCYKPGRGA